MKIDWRLLIGGLALLGGCQALPPDVPLDSASAPSPSLADMPYFLRAPIQRLYAHDPHERATAAYELAKLGSTAAPATPHLISLLDDEARVVLSDYMGGGFYSRFETTPAAQAARALGKIGDPASGALIEALQHSGAGVRRHAARALGEIRAMTALDALLNALDDPERAVRGAAAVALARYRYPRAVQAMVDRLPALTPRARLELIYVLANIGDPIVVSQLVAYAEDRDPDMRAAVAYTLGQHGDHRVRPVLLSLLRDEDAIVRANAAYALGNRGGVQAIPVLMDVLGDESESVRQSAARSLFELTGKDFGQNAEHWRRWWQQQGLGRPQGE